MNRFWADFLTTTFRVDEEWGKKEDGSQLGLPEGGDGVGDFVLEDFDDFLLSVWQLGQHYISICVYTYGLPFGSDVMLCEM